MPFPETIGEARTGAMLAERSIENDEVGLLKPHLHALAITRHDYLDRYHTAGLAKRDAYNEADEGLLTRSHPRSYGAGSIRAERTRTLSPFSG